jgi:N-acetylmuramoyl-L-alanine amidase
VTYKSNTKSRPKTDFIVVHCSASAPSVNADAAMIDRWHRQQGWQCIGYHFVIKRDGTVEEGREVDKIGAHVADWNTVSVGICLSGGVDAAQKPEDNFTLAQFAALEKLLKELKIKYPSAVIQGHRDFPKVAKACPSFDVRAWLKTTTVK